MSKKEKSDKKNLSGGLKKTGKKKIKLPEIPEELLKEFQSLDLKAFGSADGVLRKDKFKRDSVQKARDRYIINKLSRANYTLEDMLAHPALSHLSSATINRDKEAIKTAWLKNTTIDIDAERKEVLEREKMVIKIALDMFLELSNDKKLIRNNKDAKTAHYFLQRITNADNLIAQILSFTKAPVKNPGNEFLQQLADILKPEGFPGKSLVKSDDT